MCTRRKYAFVHFEKRLFKDMVSPGYVPVLKNNTGIHFTPGNCTT